mgnify:CR=1 FL=1
MEGDQTLRALIAAWRREPQAVFVRLADAYTNEGNHASALTVLRDGLSRWPRHLAARVSLARVLMEVDELEDAAEALGEVLDHEPEHWGAVDLLATLRRRQGDREGEVAALTALNRLAPGRRQVERRLQIARRELEERAAIPVPVPTGDIEPRDALPTMRHPSVEPPRTGKRVTTVPSAEVPVRPTGTPRKVRGPLPGVPRESRPPPPEDPFFNETMVDLLVAQGRVGEAREMTDRLASKRPGRPDVRSRLAELSSGADGDAPVPSRELEELMHGILAAAAADLDQLTGPIPAPPVGDDR